MALPTSGPISLSDIQGEFGGSNPISLSEYYAGGGLVPSGTSGTNGPVPSSGAISLSNFYGTSSVVIEFSDTGVGDIAVQPDIGIAGYQINSNGRVYAIQSGFVTTEIEQWATPTSVANQYEVIADLVSGTLTFGELNVWRSLGTTREWYIEQPFNGITMSSLSFQVRKIGTTTVLDTWTVDLETTRTG